MGFSHSPADIAVLTAKGRKAIDNGRWFSTLSRSLRHDILRCAFVRRYKDGDLIVAKGDRPIEWMACAKGAVRVSTRSVSGKLVTLTYIEPGVWFGDVAIIDDNPRSHDSNAHGDTTLLCVTTTDLRKILAQHTELYEALLWLQVRRIRQLFGLIEDQHASVARAARQATGAPRSGLWQGFLRERERNQSRD